MIPHLAFVLLLVAPQTTVHRHDPLNELEITQLRDTAVEPEKRLKFYTQFAAARLTAIEELRKDPKAEATERPRKVHDLLEDFLTIYDELGDNVDNFNERKDDLRKPLRQVIVADQDFKRRLSILKDDLSPAEQRECQFIIATAVDSVSAGLKDHRELLQDHEAHPRPPKKD